MLYAPARVSGPCALYGRSSTKPAAAKSPSKELRALREESARQTALLETMLRKLDDIEQTQFS